MSTTSFIKKTWQVEFGPNGFNILQPNVAYLYPLITSEKLEVFLMFLGSINKQH